MKKGIKGELEKIKNEVMEAVFPSNIYCICCGSLIDSTRPYSLCDKCVREIHWIGSRTCEKCGKALPETYRGDLCYDCMTYAHDFHKGYSCFTYGLHERELLFDFKYNNRRYLAGKFGDILYDRISCENIHPDVIIPVPVSRSRMKKRGYNQSALLAKRLSERWGVPADDGILIRKKDTPPLRGLSPAEREEKLADAFAVADGKTSKIAGKRVLLIDDIYTTGITADSCSRVLAAAGASEISLLTLASGGNRKPSLS